MAEILESETKRITEYWSKLVDSKESNKELTLDPADKKKNKWLYSESKKGALTYQELQFWKEFQKLEKDVEMGAKKVIDKVKKAVKSTKKTTRARKKKDTEKEETLTKTDTKTEPIDKIPENDLN